MIGVARPEPAFKWTWDSASFLAAIAFLVAAVAAFTYGYVTRQWETGPNVATLRQSYADCSLEEFHSAVVNETARSFGCNASVVKTKGLALRFLVPAVLLEVLALVSHVLLKA